MRAGVFDAFLHVLNRLVNAVDGFLTVAALVVFGHVELVASLIQTQQRDVHVRLATGFAGARGRRTVRRGSGGR